MHKRILQSKSCLILVVFMTILSSCSKEDDIFSPLEGTDTVLFRAAVGNNEEVNTRANTNLYDVTTSAYNCDFFIRMEGSNLNDEHKVASSRYIIPSGYSGMLIPDEDNDQPSLNWFARNKVHQFWSWTLPFLDYKNFVPDEETLAEGIEITFKDTPIKDLKSTVGTSWETESFKNGEIYETFVAGKTGDMIYTRDGQYVPIQLRHMVSKIFLNTFAIVDNMNGSTNTGLQGTITFYGLPTTATFYPCSKDSEGNNLPPHVAMPENWDYPRSSAITYTVTNKSKSYSADGSSTSYKDRWYICPEVDLHKISFKLQIYEFVNSEWVPHRTYGTQGAFYGDLSSINISRSTTGSNYDNVPTDDKSILHAGEYLVLNINLQSKGNPTINGTIYRWSNYTDYGYAYVEEGIYSRNQLVDMSTAMNSKDPEKMREFFALNGSGRDTGSDPEGLYPEYEDLRYGKELEIFELFQDIGSESYSSSDKVGSIYVADGYILDGKGHTVNCSSSSMSIGPVRDVFLRYYYQNTSSTPYTYTEYLVYIDKMGNVYTVDPVTFEETPTGQNVNDMTKNPMTINLSTGKLT